MSEVIDAIAEAEPESVEKKSITAEEFIAQRVRDSEPDPEESAEPEKSEEAVEHQPEVSSEDEIESQSESQETSDEVQAEVDDVLSKIDLSSLSEEQIEQLRQQLIPGAQKRIGELTAKKKQAEEKLEEFMRSEEEGDPLKEQVQDNPFAELQDTKSLQDKFKEMNDIIEWADDILFEAADYGPNDVVTQIEGQDKTKAEVRELLKQAKKSRDTYLPDQFKKIQRVEEAKALRQEYGKRALAEFEWLRDEKNPMAQQFVKLAADPRLDEVYKKYPELGAQLPYLIAHGVHSLNSRGSKAPVAPKQPAKKGFELTPPKSPSDSAAKSTGPETKTIKKLSELSSRFKSTGSRDDLIALRAKALAS